MSINNAENFTQIINYYNDLCISTYIIVSKINANIEHGVNYGIISNKISENTIQLFEYDIICDHTSSMKVIKRRITKLQTDLHLLQNILEKQRMCFVVNYFCSNNTKNAFPKYLLPTLKNKYVKLYNVIFDNNSSKIYFKNGNLIESI